MKKKRLSKELKDENTKEHLPRFGDCDLADETGYMPEESITNELELQIDEDKAYQYPPSHEHKF
jgi:hypothetical protein